ncbi:MAG: hypothetical protein HN350_14300 [Phycisphaerales bacterium]|jgi:hypothetical protein|nr:hypothetical protein [Phycisphaerales bacterium]
MKIMKKTILSTMMVTLICSAAFGGALDSKVVCGEASWVAHVDIEAMLASETGKMFLAAAEAREGYAKRMATLAEHVACDPLKDIRGVTIYGSQLGVHDAAVIFDATADSKKLITTLKTKTAYKTVEHGKHTVHQWTDKMRGDKTASDFACFYDKNTVVFGTSIKRIGGALDVLDTKSDTLAKTQAIKSLPEASKGAIFTLAADKIVFPEGRAPRATMLKKISSLAIEFGESAEGLFVSSNMQAGSEEDAVNMRKFIQGFVALSNMVRQQEKFAMLRELGEKITVGGDGKQVSVDASLPVKSLVRILTFIDENHKARRADKDDKDSDTK